MQYAVIKSGGKQYKVSAGDTLTVDKIDLAGKKNFAFEEVLLFVNDGKVTLGKPSIKGAVVTAALVDQVKGDKVRVAKFKAKSRYRKVMGFRPQHTVLKIEKIEVGGTKVTEKAEKTSKTAPTEPKK